MNQVSTDSRVGNNLPMAAAMLTWLGVQLAALGLCSMRIPLWAKSSRATEQLSLIVMLATQTAVASLLFPILLQNIRSTIIAIAVACPMAELASFLADISVRQFAVCEIYVSIWLVTLYLWARVLRNSSNQLVGTAIAAMISLGGPPLWYLRVEFGETGGTSPPIGAYGPVAGIISLMLPSERTTMAWGVITFLFASAVIACITNKKRSRNSRQVIH